MIEHTVMRRSLPGKEAPARRFLDAPAAFSFLRTPCSDKAPDHGAGRGRLPARLLAAQRRRSDIRWQRSAGCSGRFPWMDLLAPMRWTAVVLTRWNNAVKREDLSAGPVLFVLLYLFLQCFFVESVERAEPVG